MSVCKLYVVCGDFPAPLSKIGISTCPHSRLSQLQTGSPYNLFIDRVWTFHSRNDALAVESDLHTIFSPSHSIGEWFSICPEYISAAVANLCRCNPVRPWPRDTVEAMRQFVEDNGERLIVRPGQHG